uniref:Uncharacterized protein n=1 Tax=Oryza punctata TaxID=4537 RepID=A0A0E0MHN1_ORYPU
MAFVVLRKLIGEPGTNGMNPLPPNTGLIKAMSNMRYKGLGDSAPKREVIKGISFTLTERSKEKKLYVGKAKYSINFSNKHGIKHGTSSSRGSVHMQWLRSARGGC